MEKSFKSNAVNFGLYLGLALTAITVLVYAMNMDVFVKWQFSILLFLLVVVMGIISAVKSKKLLGGFISFKDAFTSYVITVAIGTLISTLVGIVVFNFIDPEAAQELNEKIMIATKESMESFGAPAESIQEQMKKMQDTDNFAIGKQVQNYVIGLAIYCVFGLIGAAIVKKNDPDKA